MFAFNPQEYYYNIQLLNSALSKGSVLQFSYPYGVCDKTNYEDQVEEKAIPKYGSPHLVGVVALLNGNHLLAEEKFSEAYQENKFNGYLLGVSKYYLHKDPMQYWKTSRAGRHFVLVGRECNAVGNTELAIRYYKTALELVDPKDDQSLSQILVFFAGTEDHYTYEKALNLYVLSADKNSEEYHLTIGKILLKKGDPNGALDHFEIILQNNKKNAQIWYLAGQALTQLNRLEEARYYLMQAIELEPKVTNYYVFMGHTYIYQGNIDDGIEWYKKALEINPNDDWAIESLNNIQRK